MKAICKTKPEPGIDVLDVDKPQISENEILVKIHAVSLCGSDVHVYEWTAGYEFMSMPRILGHEFAGEVVEVGSLVQGIAVGDRITANPNMPCGKCNWCKIGKIKNCQSKRGMGLTGDGAFAEFVTLNCAGEIHKIPDNVSMECASMSEPMAVALNGVDLSGFVGGQPAVVLGPGPIGLLTAQILKAFGATPVIMTGTSADANRLEVARKLGVDIIVNVDEEDPVKAVTRQVGRVNFVFEATGISHTIPQGLKMLNNGGKLMVIGIHAENATVPTIELVRRQKSIIGVYNYNENTWKRCLALMASGAVNPEPMITHRVPFSKGKEGFELAHNKIAAKVIFVPDA